MNADHFFSIGKSHIVCEDYAASGELDGITYAIISDGCSSSTNTDFGSRFLVKAAEQHIEKIDEDFFSDLVINTANFYRKTIGLEYECLYATLIVAANKNNKFYIKAFGDGLINIKGEDYNGAINEVFNISYLENAPYYLAYILDNYSNNKYKSLSSTDPIIEKTSNKLDWCTIYTPWLNIEIDEEFVSQVIISSDGIETFSSNYLMYNNSFKKYEYYSSVLNELTNFKTTKGSFVKRKALKFLKECRKNDMHHKDDLSIAVINNENNS